MLRLLATAALVLVLGVTWPTVSEGQVRPEESLTRPADSGLEVSLATRLGIPSGYARVDPTASFNGDGFGPGHVHINADFYRVSLDYERLLMSDYGAFLTGSIGLTYVHLDPKLSWQGHRSHEDFYRQELPVPIVGVRFDIPMGPRFAARATVGGGGLPRVDSGRKEGGTVYLQQIHADAGISVVYAITRALQLDVGYHLTYFYQHEKSHEDDNAFELYDNGLRV